MEQKTINTKDKPTKESLFEKGNSLAMELVRINFELQGLKEDPIKLPKIKFDAVDDQIISAAVEVFKTEDSYNVGGFKAALAEEAKFGYKDENKWRDIMDALKFQKIIHVSEKAPRSQERKVTLGEEGIARKTANK